MVASTALMWDSASPLLVGVEDYPPCGHPLWQEWHFQLHLDLQCDVQKEVSAKMQTLQKINPP